MSWTFRPSASFYTNKILLFGTASCNAVQTLLLFYAISVNVVVKYPEITLLGVVSFCVLITYLLAVIVFAAGNPITEDTYTYDINDVRSVAFDSFTLAAKDSFDDSEAFHENLPAYDGEYKAIYDDMKQNGNNSQYFEVEEEKAVLPMSEIGDFTYWIYEAETPEGVFSKKGVDLMSETETMITNHREWRDYCRRKYDDDTDPSSDFKCEPGLTPLKAYKAKSWNQTLADSIMERLDNPVQNFPEIPGMGVVTGRQIYQLLGFCTKFGIVCDVAALSLISETDLNVALNFGKQLDADFLKMTAEWDGTGIINPEVDRVTEMLAYMMDLPSQKYLIDFHFDKKFSKENQVSMFSRSIIQWGHPFVDEDTNEKLSKQKQFEKRKEFVLDNFLSEMDAIASTDHNPHLNAYYFMRVLIFDVFIKILVTDAMFALMSISLVYFYMRFMLGSWFLANVGFLEIVMSIP